ncbi:ribosomal large subunit proteins 60S L5, and 50S L18 [Rhizoctonia solani]|uniref:Ribosomal large subunit proteins 60S L5, and 50S L18 n=1 Tax=Rhizoctonia solani TaxID=456999 RepID=A0A8H8NPP0_9AGAM|nr:ribosomal large subunit proteins 60S L5, and 50S L18 [Rhizoctonia solani]QRW16507.1 ribosomal large subunit proteins 60S L5, and 50S L18 [Rhizoctonia solani]
MPFVKEVKTNAYFSRYQVKYRRRREGKTDYYARKRLVVQAKNKYNAPKYRLVVRFSNKNITVQVVYARLQGDFVLVAANSRELPRYGIEHGLTNWTAAYATGLLAARRALTKLGLADKYQGVAEPDGTISLTEAVEDAPRPFKAYLDVGLKRTSTGSRVFGALKGASDGGIFIPHSEKRFPDTIARANRWMPRCSRSTSLVATLRSTWRAWKRNDERFKKQFSTYLESGVGSEDIEEIYTNAYAAIREDPSFKPTDKDKDWKAESLKHRSKKLTTNSARSTSSKRSRRSRLVKRLVKTMTSRFLLDLAFDCYVVCAPLLSLLYFPMSTRPKYPALSGLTLKHQDLV